MTTIVEHRAAYAEGADVVEVAQRLLAAVDTSHVDAFASVVPDTVRDEAAVLADRARHADGPLAGIPVALKDVVGVRGHISRGGTAVLARHAADDAPMTRRLRDAGALVVGTTRMTELGLSPIGTNASGPSPRNPFDLSRTAGGSSSGSAAAVAARQVVLAVGSDGGGSIRIPAALCGLVGLKPTPGLVPDTGCLPTGWWSLNAYGPLARSVADCAIGLAVLAGQDQREPTPPDRLVVGVVDTWWGEPDAAVDRACRDALEASPAVQVRRVDVPSVALARSVEYATVGPEVAAAVAGPFGHSPDRFGVDVQATMSLARTVTAIDYIRAQQVRSVLADEIAAVLAEVDVIATPTTHCTAPRPDPAAWREGLLDESLLRRLTATTFPANLCGLPAISVPVGVDPAGLPIGLQLVGRPFGEDALLDAAARIERDVSGDPPRPRHVHQPLT